MHGYEPVSEWQLGILHDGAFAKALTVMTILAFIAYLVILPIPMHMPAFWAYMRPFLLYLPQLGYAGCFVGIF